MSPSVVVSSPARLLAPTTSREPRDRHVWTIESIYVATDYGNGAIWRLRPQ